MTKQTPALWLAVHHHRHGESIYPFFQAEAPTEAQVVEDTGLDFEPEHEEWIDIDGAHELPPALAAAPLMAEALIACERALQCHIGKESLADHFPKKLAMVRAALKAAGWEG